MVPHQDDYIDGSNVRAVELAQGGDSEAFTTLVRHFEGEIYGYLVGLVGNDEEARDLTQDTMLRVWEKLPTLQDVSRFKPWLYSIARNLVYDLLRRKQRHKKKASWQSWEDLKEKDRAIAVPDSEKRVENAELLKQALTELTRKYRECLLLQVVGEFSHQEIAELVGISTASVSVYIYNARKQLREIFQRLEVELHYQEKGGQIDE